MEATISGEDYIIEEATSDDNEKIRKIYEDITYDGAIDIQFRRGDTPYDSVRTEGDDFVMLKCCIEATGEIIGVGSCCIHRMYLNGEIKRVGYLNGLKVVPEYQGRNTVLPRAFAAMKEALAGRADICIASMLKSEEHNIKMLEKRRRIMPTYIRQCEYTTFCIKPAASMGKLRLERGFDSETEAFYNERLKNYNLAKVGEIRGIRPENYIILKKDGRIIAACAIHDEKKYKNYYLNGYNGIMRVMSKLPSQLFGYPSFPKEKSIVNTAEMSRLLFDDSVSLEERKNFIVSASSFARDYNILLLGLTDTDITFKAAKKIRDVNISDYLYTVEWDEEHSITSRPVMCDVSLM